MRLGAAVASARPDPPCPPARHSLQSPTARPPLMPGEAGDPPAAELLLYRASMGEATRHPYLRAINPPPPHLRLPNSAAISTPTR